MESSVFIQSLFFCHQAVQSVKEQWWTSPSTSIFTCSPSLNSSIFFWICLFLCQIAHIFIHYESFISSQQCSFPCLNLLFPSSHCLATFPVVSLSVAIFSYYTNFFSSLSSLHGGSEKPKASREGGASPGGSSDDYAYPPPPVPAYSLSLPNSPVLYKKGTTGGQSRNIATPGRTPSSPGTNPLRAHTAPSSPAAQRSTRHQGVSTVPTPSRQHGGQTGTHNRFHDEPLNCPMMIHYATTPHHSECQNPPKHKKNKEKEQQLKHSQHPDLIQQHSVEELRSTVQAVTSSIEHHTQDVHHLGQKMVAATEMITDSMEENAQALSLLAEVVDKLQGLIVANKHPESSPPHRLKQHTPPAPSPRVSSVSPKSLCKPPTLYPYHLSTSSSNSCSSSSSSTSVSSCADGFAPSRSPKRMNGGSKRTMVTFGVVQRPGGSNGQMRLNNGSVSSTSLEQDCNSSGCLTTKKKKKNK